MNTWTGERHRVKYQWYVLGKSVEDLESNINPAI